MNNVCQTCRLWTCDATCVYWRYRNPQEAKDLEQALVTLGKRVKPLTPNSNGGA